MPREKSDWSKKADELIAQLPVVKGKKRFDARSFKGCRVDGKWDRTKIAEVCEAKGSKEKVFEGKADAVLSYLTHLDSKPPSSGRKPGAKKYVVKSQPEPNFLAKRTYSGLSASDIGKLITMLTEIQKDRKEQEIAGLRAKKEQIEKQLKELGVK